MRFGAFGPFECRPLGDRQEAAREIAGSGRGGTEGLI